MKQYIKAFLCGVAGLIGFTACSTDPVYFDHVQRIYFATDSLNFSFGNKVIEMTEYTLEYPLTVMGSPAEQVRKFRIEVVDSGTNALEGVHYKLQQEAYEVLPDSVNAYLPVLLIRENLDPGETYRIRFRIVATDDFLPGVDESLKGVVTFNDYLEKPGWWDNLYYYLGDYQQEKYQKFVELNGGNFITEDELWSNFLVYLFVFKEVSEYFEAHPEWGIEWPRDVEWPF